MFTLPSGQMTGEEMADVYLSNRMKIARFLKKNKAPFIAVVYKDAAIHRCDI